MLDIPLWKKHFKQAREYFFNSYIYIWLCLWYGLDVLYEKKHCIYVLYFVIQS